MATTRINPNVKIETFYRLRFFCILGLIVLLLVCGVRGYKILSSPKVPATISDSGRTLREDNSGKSFMMHYYRLQYEVDGEHYEKEQSTILPFLHHHGDSVSVAYNPEYPDRIYSIDVFEHACVIGAVLIAFLLGLQSFIRAIEREPFGTGGPS